MGFMAARLGDPHICPMFDGPKPHVGGPVLPPSQASVFTGKMLQARFTDKLTCASAPDLFASGSPTVMVVGQMAARALRDVTAHGGLCMMGCPTVLIGDVGMSMVGPGGMSMPPLGGMAAAGAAGAAGAAQVGLAKYGNAIKIDGDEAFQKQVQADLDEIAKTPTGKKLLDDLDKSGKTVTIKKTDKGNSCGRTADGLIKPDGTRGPGCDSTVNYNPDKTSLGPAAWQTRPPAVGLAHELIHAQHNSEGSNDPSLVDNDSKPDPNNPGQMAQIKREEVRTSGIPPHDKEPYTENKIRAEWDPPQSQRPWY